MAGKFLSAAFVFAAGFLVNASAALAASDPTKIGDNIKGLVEPNAKSIWYVLLIVGVIGLALTRRGSKAVGAIGVIVVSGIAIFNPIGVSEMMQAIANRVV